MRFGLVSTPKGHINPYLYPIKVWEERDSFINHDLSMFDKVGKQRAGLPFFPNGAPHKGLSINDVTLGGLLLGKGGVVMSKPRSDGGKGWGFGLFSTSKVM